MTLIIRVAICCGTVNGRGGVALGNVIHTEECQGSEILFKQVILKWLLWKWLEIFENNIQHCFKLATSSMIHNSEMTKPF